MNNYAPFTDESLHYLKLLSQQYPTQQSVFSEIINLQAILNLPKGTEHFISDIHGEYDAFKHILSNCSGVIREKLDLLYHDTITEKEIAELCTLIYYPREKLAQLRGEGRFNSERCRMTLEQLIRLSRFLASKYTRSKVRKAMPVEFGYIIDELLHTQENEDINRQVYHTRILESILDTGSEDDFICSLSDLIKRLAVDHLHIVGDIYDRGSHADRIMDILTTYHSLDIEWGNHDILWMGAAAGSESCIAAVLYNNIRYGNLEILENGYGIGLRELATFADSVYTQSDSLSPLMKAITVLMFKTEGQMLHKHPEYGMADRLLFEKINWNSGTIKLDGKDYTLGTSDFPTVNKLSPCELNRDESVILQNLKNAFLNSERLKHHMEFLYRHGSIYRCCNGNLLFHGCVPLDEDGNLDEIMLDERKLQGKSYMDVVDRLVRRTYTRRESNDLDAMWYLWSGKKSPLCGRSVRTFEHAYLSNSGTWDETQNPYYTFCREKKTCVMLLHEFGLYAHNSHIINGHTPVRARNGESPVKADGKLLVIDGGFCKAYQKRTGVAGYTLIFNSHSMKIKAHHPFENIKKALSENADITSDTEVFEKESQRLMIADTDNGKQIAERIEELKQLLAAYRLGTIKEPSRPR